MKTVYPGEDDLGAMLNDQESDCCPAMAGHAVQIWRDGLGPTDAQVQDLFQKACGASTQGCSVTAVLWHWLLHGIDGHHIACFGPIANLERAVERCGMAFAHLDHFDGIQNHCVLVVRATPDEVWAVSGGRVYTHTRAAHDAAVVRQWAGSPKLDPLVLWWAFTGHWRWPALLLVAVTISCYGFLR